ncbi:hypothetical protein [Microbacterium sp. AK031]|uniref:hypothetical protein n=1 Tax=Microbacterium sp. AK031 TaxID=2723076 RepID=UPI002166CF72|nr:hypothetical protein [Microbacterium sp. AK031]MCS3842859.1 O-antigen/teichoic acid export membrane protein [Microbacterium sp. AK031]
MTTIGFFAIAVFGLGALSVVTDADIISVPDTGQAPGITGTIVAVAVFAGIFYLAVRITHPKFRSVWTISIATAFAHMLAAAIGALVVTGDFVNALAVMGELITGGASVVILATAAIAGWAGVALRRTRAKRPRWPWERDDIDEN